MKTCENCKYSEPIGGGLACMGQKGMPFVIASDYCENWKTTRQTNADRIRSVSDEDLAAKMARLRDWTGCPAPIVSCHDDCYTCWLDWLKKEAE